MAVVPEAALVRLTPAPAAVIRIERNVELNSGVKPGVTAWRQVFRITSGTGPVFVSEVTTILADRVNITRTVREKTAQEIDAEKLAGVTTDLGANPMGRALKQAYEALFFLANDVRSRHGQAALTPAQFRTAVEGLNAIPDAAFFDWIRTKV